MCVHVNTCIRVSNTCTRLSKYVHSWLKICVYMSQYTCIRVSKHVHT
jgi:hypothetical protein